jgi:predicted ATPase/DNA-binding CsgD family transcriptional regulator
VATRLTPGEREVVALVVQGLTNRQVADCLGISERTVDGRIQRIFRKLGLTRRRQLAAWLAGAGDPGPAARQSSLVGRDEELLGVVRLARSQALVTITGPGGVGKTQLALHAARLLEREFPNGARFVNMSSTPYGDLVEGSVLTALSLRHDTARPARAILTAHLSGGPELLVLDNCEHVIDEVAALVDHLLSTCGGLHVIATSREPLLMAGEHVRQLAPLELPRADRPLPGDALTRFAALRLFAERAEQAGARLQQRPEDLEVVAEICRRVDGLPLALELAAARTPTMSLASLLARLREEEGLLVLGGGRRSVEDRHRTVQATVGWSYGLLSREERTLFARLSVFAGTFDDEAARSVGSAAPLTDGAVAELLSNLVSKSLVAGIPGDDGGYRYRLLDTLRAFGHEKLVGAGKEEAIRERQARHYADVLAEPTLSWTRVALERFRDQLEDVRAALAWSIANQPEFVRLICGRLVGFWGRHGDLAEGCQWMARILDRSSSEDMHRAVAYANRSWLAQRHGSFELAERCARESLRLQRLLGDRASVADALCRVADVARNRGDNEAARPPAEEAVALFRAVGPPLDLALALMILGSVRGRQGEFEAGRGHLEEAIEIFAAIGELSGVAMCRGWLGELCLHQDRVDGAREHLTAALRIFRDMPDGWMAANLCDLLSWLAVADRDPYRAVRLAGAAHSVRQRIGAAQPPALAGALERPLREARRALGSHAEGAWRQGAAADVERAIAYALREAVPERTDGPSTPGGLTRRELQVVPLIARGLPDREIATLLNVSVRTAEYHVEQIRTKLGCASRAQVAAWAAENGIARTPVSYR